MHVVVPVRTCNVSICALGDDSVNVSVSFDGSNYDLLSSGSSWEKAFDSVLENVTAPAVVQFEVNNNGGFGGFAATIHSECSDGYTSTVITDDGNSYFNVVHSENAKYEMTNFSRFGNGTRSLVDQGNPATSPTCDCLDECEGDCDGDGDCISDLVCYHRTNDGTANIPPGCTGDAHETSHDYCYDPNWDTVQCMDPNAYWMWNGAGSDRIIFELDLFSDYTANGDGLVEDEDGFVLIERHRDVANGYFSTDVLTTGLENEDNSSANTYCIIGGLDSSAYLQSDGYYDLKLIFKHSDGSEDVLEWTQASWITESNITGADLSKITSETRTDCAAFKGLGLSGTSYNMTYIDGNGASGCWFHAVASVGAWNGGIPSHNGRVAYSSSLWIRPGIVLLPVLQVLTLKHQT